MKFYAKCSISMAGLNQKYDLNRRQNYFPNSLQQCKIEMSKIGIFQVKYLIENLFQKFVIRTYNF